MKAVRQSGKVRKYRVIADYFREKILSGALSPGDLLPSIREVNALFGVGSSTTIQAFDLLIEDGVIETRNKARAVVVKNTLSRFAWKLFLHNNPRVAQNGLIAEQLSELCTTMSMPKGIELAYRRYFACTIDSLREPDGFDTPIEGDETLRSVLCERLRHRGITCSPSQIFLFRSRTQAYAVLASVLLTPKTLACYQAIGLAQSYQWGATFTRYKLNLPSDHHGVSITLMTSCPQDRVLLIQPSFAWPTADTTDSIRREQIVHYCQSTSVPIIEDDIDAELYKLSDQPHPLKSQDTNDSIVYLGGVPPVMGQDVSLCWACVPSELCHPVRQQLAVSFGECPISAVRQKMILEFMQNGWMDELFTLWRRHIGRTHKKCFEILQKELSGLATWQTTQVFSGLWLRLETLKVQDLPAAWWEKRDVIPGDAFGCESCRHVFIPLTGRPDEFERRVSSLKNEILRVDGGQHA